MKHLNLSALLVPSFVFNIFVPSVAAHVNGLRRGRDSGEHPPRALGSASESALASRVWLRRRAVDAARRMAH